MRKKINILIISSIIAIITLSSIQYYLITNTFELKKKSFINEANSNLTFLDNSDKKEELDALFAKAAKKLIFNYQKGLLPKEKFIQEFNKINDSINNEFNQYFEKEIAKKNLEFPIDFQQQISSLILLNHNNQTTSLDSLISTKTEGVLLYGKKLDPTTRFKISTGKWDTDSQSSNTKDTLINNERLHLEIKTESYIEIPNWQLLILKRISGILSLSIGSILIVSSLFIYALLLLIKQKKIAEIKTDFVNNITHELNTPLSTLNIATKTLQQEAVLENKQLIKNTVDTIDRQGKRLQKLVQNVVNNSLGFNQIELQKEHIKEQNLILQLIKDYQLTNNKTTITTHLQNKNQLLYLDKFHFSTALLNLFDNAVKYGSSTILIHTENEKNNYQIKIQDNGIGIKKQHLNKVFEKFYRVKNTDIHNIKGLGLGLYYVQQIVQAHNGNIQIKSTFNKGTTIIINIPQNETNFIS